MENAVIHHISGRLDNHTALTKNQQNNLDSLIRISHKFHSDAGIPSAPEVHISERLFVLESGHQPNFLPYPGVWKKVFLLHRILHYLTMKDHDGIAVFGFADQNLSTAKLLYENKIPAINREGNKKFGFKVKESEKWKRFNTIKKPSKDNWEQELCNVKNYYHQYLPKGKIESDSLTQNIDNLTGIMELCYSRADNRADLNAFIFARICHDVFDIPVHFFRYSDVQKEYLFMEEWQKILRSAPDYTRVYNKTIRENELNLAPVPPYLIPFWYHCSCGAKIALSTDPLSGYTGTCPVCEARVSFPFPDADFLAETMKNMGLSAVARNVIFSEGLGTHLFISGSGGGLRYGKVANEISRTLSLHIPVTLSWQSRDYYIGIIHRAALKDILKLLNLTSDELISGQSDKKIAGYLGTLRERIEDLKQNPENKREIAKYSGLYRSISTQMMMTKKMFSTIPSILDLLVNFPASTIINWWDDALNSVQMHDKGEILMLDQDVFYRQGTRREFSLEEIPRIYHSIESIEL